MCTIPLCNCCRKILTLPLAAWVILAVSVGALTAAFCAQYAFAVKACELCYWQRVPYGITLVLAGLTLLVWPQEKKARVLTGLACLAFVAGIGLAFFHTGVEQHWWNDVVSCGIPSLKHLDLNADMSINAMRDQLLATVNVPCDEITWSFLGLSMANWNILASLVLAIYAGLAAFGCAEGEGTTCRFCRSCKPKDGTP